MLQIVALAAVKEREGGFWSWVAVNRLGQRDKKHINRSMGTIFRNSYTPAHVLLI